VSYEERVVDPKGDVYVVGSPSERARLIAQGYKDFKPEGQPAAKAESVDSPATSESSPARRKQ
jgi:hypothetical protein